MPEEPLEVLAKLDVLEVQVILAQLLEVSWLQYGDEVLDSQLGLCGIKVGSAELGC
jgi:hypothetical protein